MKKSYTKTFANEEHLKIWWNTFKGDLAFCYEVGSPGEFKVRFSLKNQ